MRELVFSIANNKKDMEIRKNTTEEEVTVLKLMEEVLFGIFSVVKGFKMLRGSKIRET